MGAGQNAYGFDFSREIFAMALFQALDLSRISGVADFAEEAWKKKGSAHADAAMDFPVGNVHAKVGEGFMPGEDMLESAV